LGQFQKSNIPWNKGLNAETNDTLRRLAIERRFKMCPYFTNGIVNLCLFCYANAGFDADNLTRLSMGKCLRHWIDV
jgi:hypothetical protein